MPKPLLLLLCLHCVHCRAGRTALHLAAEEGLNAIVQQLLAAGAYADSTDSSGSTAAQLAVAHGHTATAVLLQVHAQRTAGSAGLLAYEDGSDGNSNSSSSNNTAVVLRISSHNANADRSPQQHWSLAAARQLMLTL